MTYSPATSSFPSSLDTTVDPVATSVTGTFDHAGLHTYNNDAIEKLQAKVGVNSSAVTASLDYKINNTSSSDPGHKHTLANGASDVTSSATEVNVLDGIPATLTATELGYVDGVTSAIQTQIDTKASLVSPSFTTPDLGVATATSINKVTITAPASSATLTLVTGSSLITSGAYAITLTSTGTTNITLPTSGTIITDTSTVTLTNKRVTRRAPAVTQSATPAINTDVTDVAHITGLAQAITSMTSSLTGTPVEGDMLRIDFTDNGTTRAITWGASFESSTGAVLPTTTVISTRLDTVFAWNTVTSKWRCVGVA